MSLTYYMDDMEKRVTEEKDRLQQMFNTIPRDKLSMVEELITQAARLRVLLDDNWIWHYSYNPNGA